MLGNQWHRKERPLLSLLGMGGGAGSPASTSAGPGLTVTGGTTHEPGNGYIYHVFQVNPSPGGNPLSDSPFQVSGGDLPGSQVVVVAGGGSGGTYYGAGGGAGGLAWTPTAYTISEGSYMVTVGAGGATTPSTSASGNKGDNSAFGPPTDANDVQCEGGGPGGNYGSPGGGGGTGGSGGGRGSKPGGPWNGWGANQPTIPNPPNYDDRGGAGGGYGTSLSGYSPGGGGGAGGDGHPGVEGPGGGNGGNGWQCPGFEYPLVGMSPYAYNPTGDNSTPAWDPANNYYAGGGAAGCYSTCSGNRNGSGGKGGGGMGHNTGTPAPTYDETGAPGLGGGGGGYHPAPSTRNNKGGNGVCIIRYPDAL